MNELVWSQKALDMLELLLDHEGCSSGELAVISDIERDEIKKWMRLFEKHDIGEYTIQDGMYHFWLSPFGRDLAISKKGE